MLHNSFHKVMGPYSIANLASLVNAKVYNNDPKALIKGAADIDNASEGYITFISIKKTLNKLKKSNASACLINKYDPDYFSNNMIYLEVSDPHVAFALISQKFYPTESVIPKISKNCEISDRNIYNNSIRVDSYSVIEEKVTIGSNVWIGSNCFIGKGVIIGDGTRVLSNTSIECAEIGKNVLIYSGVRIGQKGFGFAPTKSGHVPIPQLGIVKIEDNVEIGANSCVDRGSYGDTIIGKGTFIDNLVHIAHNVKIGKYCAIAGQVGIAGSAVIDDYCMFGGQVGIGGHINVGKAVQAGGQSGITKSVKAGSKVSGTPAVSLNDYHRQAILLNKLTKSKG